MNLSKWLIVPVFALACCLIGCGPDTSTTIIEAEPQTEQEIADTDAAYAEQYNQQAENYEN